MNDKNRGQIAADAARIYDEYYISGLFAQWAPHLINAATVKSGDRVLDVACGTGVLTGAVAEAVGEGGSAIGVDINANMLTVAREKYPSIEWLEAPAESLPFDDATFDAVVSQFGLMYFADQQAALGEMLRVLRPGGKLAVAVWDKMENLPAYALEEKLIVRELGEKFSDQSMFGLGNKEKLRELFSTAGMPVCDIRTIEGAARFASINDWIYADFNGWTEDGEIDDAQFERLLGVARNELSKFQNSDGSVSFSTPAHIVSAASTRPEGSA